MGKLFKIVTIILIIIALAILGVFIYSDGHSEKIGENNLGAVYKVTYGHSNDPSVTIGIVSGMHSREKLHQYVLPYVSKAFAFLHPDVKVVNYIVNVTKDPEDFTKGRANGESLVHDYVVKDVKKEDFDVVIIGHDHEPGYGEAYYIATPVMDNASVKLAKKVTRDIGFNHYTRNKSQPTTSTSILKVDKPIVDTGTRVFVYEIPEVDGKVNAFYKSYQLVNATYNRLKK